MSETATEQAQRWVEIWAYGMEFYAQSCTAETLAENSELAKKYARQWSRARERYWGAMARRFVATNSPDPDIDWFGDDDGGTG